MSEYGIKLKGLKPCPFCGGKAEAFEKGRPVEGWFWYDIQCENCGANVSGESENPYDRKQDGKAEETARANWNRRVIK